MSRKAFDFKAQAFIDRRAPRNRSTLAYEAPDGSCQERVGELVQRMGAWVLLTDDGEALHFDFRQQTIYRAHVGRLVRVGRFKMLRSEVVT